MLLLLFSFSLRAQRSFARLGICKIGLHRAQRQAVDAAVLQLGLCLQLLEHASWNAHRERRVQVLSQFSATHGRHSTGLPRARKPWMKRGRGLDRPQVARYIHGSYIPQLRSRAWKERPTPPSHASRPWPCACRPSGRTSCARPYARLIPRRPAGRSGDLGDRKSAAVALPLHPM